jgi:hypothetical protein
MIQGLGTEVFRFSESILFSHDMFPALNYAENNRDRRCVEITGLLPICLKLPSGGIREQPTVQVWA